MWSILTLIYLVNIIPKYKIVNNYNIPSLRCIRVFESVARNQSVSKAATELYMSTSAISLNIKNLEEHLGVKLFDRIGRGLVINQDGDHLYTIIVPFLTEAASKFSNFKDEKKTTAITVQSYVMASINWLNKRLINFKQYKKNKLKLTIVTPDEMNFAPSLADCAFVLERNPKTLHSRFVWEKVFPHAITPICTNGFLEQYGGKITMEDLAHLPIICTSSDIGDWKKWFSAFCPNIEWAPYIVVGDKQTALNIAMDSHGLVLVNMPFVLDQIMASSMHQPFEETLWDGEWGIIYEKNSRKAELIEEMIAYFNAN